jgi:hypothetical protein
MTTINLYNVQDPMSKGEHEQSFTVISDEWKKQGNDPFSLFIT